MLRREVFMMFIGSRPRVIMAMLQYLAEKAQYTTQAVEKGVAWAKKIAQGDYAPPARVEAPAPVVTPAAMPDEATEAMPARVEDAFARAADSLRRREQAIRNRVAEIQGAG